MELGATKHLIKAEHDLTDIFNDITSMLSGGTGA